MNGGPVGLPASAEYVDTIYHCEMAEFQMWGGISLDTENVINRRAFVDANGKPVKPIKAEELMGRRPDIQFHGTNKWQQGYNTGTTGAQQSTTGEFEKIPSGQFIPTAKIAKYLPDPSLA